MEAKDIKECKVNIFVCLYQLLKLEHFADYFFEIKIL